MPPEHGLRRTHMKLVTFTDSAGTRIGIANDDGIVDLKKADADLPRDMIGLMSAWSTARDAVERAATPQSRRAARRGQTRSAGAASRKDPGDRPQLRRPHRGERPEDARAAGLVLQSTSTSVNAPFDPIELPKVSTLARLRSRTRRRHRQALQARAEARRRTRSIFGYCVGNDVTVRDWQFKTPQWMLGKSLRHARALRPVDRHGRRDRRPARARHPRLRQRREAPGLEHQAPGLQRLRSDRARLAKR